MHAPATTVRDRLGGWGRVEEVDGDSCVLRMTSDSLDWPVTALCAIDADFEVRSPPELLDHIQGLHDRLGRAAAKGDRAPTAQAMAPGEDR